MAEEHSDDAGHGIGDQPPKPGLPAVVIEYYQARRGGSRLGRWVCRLPRPGWATVIVLLMTGAAIYWLATDHAAWVMARRFDAMLPGNSADGAVSYDGKQLLAVLGDIQTIRIYDVATGNTVRDLRRPAGTTITGTFSPDGSRIWSMGSDQQGIFWEVSTGKPLATLPAAGFIESRSPFSADGRWVAAADKNTLRICDGHSGAVLAELAAQCRDPIFSPDGRFLVGVGPGNADISIWETQTWRQIAAFYVGYPSGPSGCIYGAGLVFSPDSKTVAMACGPSPIALWDAATNQVSHAYTAVGGTSGCSFSPDGRHLTVYTTSAGPAELFDTTTRMRVGGLASFGYEPVVSPDGTHIAGDRTVGSFPGLKPLATVGAGERIAWLADGRAFVSQ